MSSSIPAVIAALVPMFGSVPTFVGEPVQGQAGDFVAVAWAGPDNAAVVSLDTLSSYSLAPSREDYHVTNQIVTWQGNSDLSACIGRAYTIRDVLHAGLITDQTLGGVVMQAEIVESALMLNQTQGGATITLTVTVHVQATV